MGKPALYSRDKLMPTFKNFGVNKESKSFIPHTSSKFKTVIL